MLQLKVKKKPSIQVFASEEGGPKFWSINENELETYTP